MFRKMARRLLRPKAEIDRFLTRAEGVLHVGANTGQERGLYARLALDVVWIEPIPEVFAELQANIARLSRQRAFRYLLTDADRDEVELKIANNNGAASSIFEIGALREIWPEIEYSSTLRMPGTTLATFLEREQIDPSRHDALVLDTQGSELLVLRGAGERLREFRFVKTEVADFEAYVGCCQLDDLNAYLAGFGFHERQRMKFAENSTGGHYFDILYERDGY